MTIPLKSFMNWNFSNGIFIHNHPPSMHLCICLVHTQYKSFLKVEGPSSYIKSKWNCEHPFCSYDCTMSFRVQEWLCTVHAPTKSTNGPYHMHPCIKTSQNRYTNTALHSAVWVCHLGTAKFLVKELEVSSRYHMTAQHNPAIYLKYCSISTEAHAV